MYEFLVVILDHNHSIVSTATIKRFNILTKYWYHIESFYQNTRLYFVYFLACRRIFLFPTRISLFYDRIAKIYFDTLEIHNKGVYENSCKFLTSCWNLKLKEVILDANINVQFSPKILFHNFDIFPDIFLTKLKQHNLYRII